MGGFSSLPTLATAVHQKPVVIDSDYKTTDFVESVAFLICFSNFAQHFFRKIELLDLWFGRHLFGLSGCDSVSLMNSVAFSYVHPLQVLGKHWIIDRKCWRLWSQFVVILNANDLIVYIVWNVWNHILVVI